MRVRDKIEIVKKENESKRLGLRNESKRKHI